MELDFQYTQPAAKPIFKKEREGPLRILVLDDFSGRSNRGSLEHGAALAERPLVPVDVDNFEDALFRFAPRLSISLGDAESTTATVEIKNLDDFHPDTLYAKLAIFQAFREMRERMADPSTFTKEAEELQRLMAQGGPDAQPPAPTGEKREDDDTTLTRILGRAPAERPQARTADRRPNARSRRHRRRVRRHPPR